MFGIFDIFKSNYQRLKDLREVYSADTVASMVNDRLKKLNVNETVTGVEIDAFLKITRLGSDRTLVTLPGYQAAMRFSSIAEKADLRLPEVGNSL
ncbi:hypothetical protein [Photobacterium nomapromontoriensis]|uniref:hypothetical protein n=1 Tax=Photobacterium nomapromontoriensis TaxID=2910237 RepID=UPI003D1106B3